MDSNTSKLVQKQLWYIHLGEADKKKVVNTSTFTKCQPIQRNSTIEYKRHSPSSPE